MLSMSRAKERRDFAKERSGRSSKSAETTFWGSKYSLWYSAEGIFHYKISFTVCCKGVNSEKLFGFGAHYFDLQVVEKSFSTSTEGP